MTLAAFTQGHTQATQGHTAWHLLTYLPLHPGCMGLCAVLCCAMVRYGRRGVLLPHLSTWLRSMCT